MFFTPQDERAPLLLYRFTEPGRPSQSQRPSAKLVKVRYGSRFQRDSLVGRFPSKFRLITAKMAVGGVLA